MKRLAIGALALTLALSPLAAYSQVECPELNSAQVKVLEKTWHYGEKNLGKGWGVKMSALAYQESKLGKDKHGAGSYGTFQMQPATVTDMNDLKPTGRLLKGIKTRLLNEFEYSANESAKYLTFWKDKGYSDARIFSHYNGGYKVGAKQQHYSRSVQKNIKLLSQCYVYQDGRVHARTTG